jgi:Mrp family chromosome partitioning ATPase
MSKPLFGDAAVRLGYVTEDAVNTALREQAQLRQKGSASSPIGTLLAERGLLTPEQITAVLRHLANSGLPLSEDGIRLAARLKVLHAASSNLIGVAATEPGDAATLACELAVALAVMEQGRVILIDGDPREPLVHRLVQVPAAPGLMDHLRMRANTVPAPADGGQQARVELIGTPLASVSSLTVLPLGKTGPDVGALSMSPEAGLLLNELRQRYRYVIVVLGDVLCHPEAAVTASRCDGILLGLRAGQSDKAQLHHVQQLLDGLKVPLSGVVLTRPPAHNAPLMRKRA